MSVVTIPASSSRCASSSSRSAKTARARFTGDVARHAGNASRAARAAVSTSSPPDSGTCASSSPFAGLRLSWVAVAIGATHAPPT